MLRNAFANLITEGIGLRLNYIAAAIADLVMAIDVANAKLRISLSGETLPTVTTVATCTAVTTVTTVTTCSTVTNVASLGGVAANAMVQESMETSWSTCIRGRIT